MKEKKSLIMRLLKINMFVVSGIGGLLLLVVIFAPQPSYKHGFKTISDLDQFGQTIDEWIKMEGKDFLKPNYETYYKEKFSPTLGRKIREKFEWLRYKLYLKREPLFSESFFKTILGEVTKNRLKQGWNGDIVQKITLNENSKVIVFGVVQGAFHSLVRYLKELKTLGIIGEDLKVTNPDHYFVFLGNVVSRSPYTLEMLSLLLRLVQVNPINVFYLKGTNEFLDYWKQHTLKTELEMRAYHWSSSPIPLEKEVQAFFDTLPLTLYATMPFLEEEKKVPYFRVAPFVEKAHLVELLNDASYATFIQKKSSEKIDTFDVRKHKEGLDVAQENIVLKAIVTDIRKRDTFEDMDGLRLLPPVDGVTAWTVLSCPSEPYRLVLKFFYDAFAIITPAKKLNDWTLTLYHRDIRKKEDTSFKTRVVHFFTGKGVGEKGTEKVKEKVVEQPVAKKEIVHEVVKGITKEKEKKKEVIPGQRPD